MPRGPKWSEEECIELCRAWMSVSEDPVVGDEQTSASFWARIYDLWCKKCSGAGRTPTALKNQWNGKIQPDCQKFAGFFKRSIEAHESGTTLAEIIKATESIFLEMEKRTFEFIECWKVLKKCQKFQVSSASTSPVLPEKTKEEKVKTHRDHDEAAQMNGSDEEMQITPQAKRPIGTKQAKNA